MSSFKHIVIAGATGNVGKPLVQTLLADGSFTVTVLTRKSSTATIPSGAKSISVDYESHTELVSALKGQEALVITLGAHDLEKNSKALVDAAVEAGVKRVFTSDFGNDTSVPPGSTNPFFAPKIAVVKYLEQKAAVGTITWTAVFSGPFLDWGLAVGFTGFDIKGKKATLYDDGQYTHKTTTIPDVIKAVVSILKSPSSTANRAVRISTATITQRQILEHLESISGTKYEITNVDSVELGKSSFQKLVGGDHSFPVIVGLVVSTIFGPESTTRWEKDDNALVGLPASGDWKKIVEDAVKAAA